MFDDIKAAHSSFILLKKGDKEPREPELELFGGVLTGFLNLSNSAHKFMLSLQAAWSVDQYVYKSVLR